MSAVSPFLFNGLGCRVVKIMHNERQTTCHPTQSIVTATLIITQIHNQTLSRPWKAAQNIMTPNKSFEAHWKNTQNNRLKQRAGNASLSSVFLKRLPDHLLEQYQTTGFLHLQQNGQTIQHFQNVNSHLSTLSEHFEHPEVLNNSWPRVWTHWLEQYPVF